MAAAAAAPEAAGISGAAGAAAPTAAASTAGTAAAAVSGTAAADGLPMPRRLGAILAVSLSVGVSVLDVSIANVALPTIARDLAVSEAASIWVVNAYQIATMVSLLALSALGEIAGYRKVYLAGLLLFLAASVGCACSTSLQTLVAARVVQGFGAAALGSINTTLIRLIYPQSQLGRGMGINATVVALSSVAGPTVAAAILAVASWEWLFAINVPICLAAFALSRRFLPPNPAGAPRRRLDRRDVLLNALTFGLLMAAVEGFSHGADLRLILLAAAATALVGTCYVRRQLRERYPLLPFDLLRIPLFAVSVGTSICSYLGQMAAMVALPFFLQQTYGFDAVHTGLLLTAWPAVIILVAPLAGWLVERVHAGLLGGIGLAVMAAGALLLALLPAGATALDFVLRMLLCGAGFALFQSPNNSVLIASAPPERSGAASGMLATARLIGQTVGAAMMALLFHTLGSGAPRAAMYLAAAFAATAAAVSFARLRLPLPEALRVRR